MAGSESFFRKVVRFVANPATDWNELSTRQQEARELELEKSELKAMIERKRRNDFVRKREFDTLRRVRREGLSPEQLAALGSSSRLDDSEARVTEHAAARPSGVKAKIDEIEQQMVGDGGFAPPRAAPPAFTPTDRGRLPPSRPGALPSGPGSLPPLSFHPSSAAAPLVDDGDGLLPALPPLPAGTEAAAPGPEAAPAQMGRGLPPLAAAPAVAIDRSPRPGQAGAFAQAVAVEVSEVVHDPELDEAVIAFANADFALCEGALRRAIQDGGPRAQHAETWLVLFDLYRATGQQQRFESLALEYAQQFGWSAPQWMSLPQLVAEATAREADHLPRRHVARAATSPGAAPTPAIRPDVGWVCPPQLDVDAVARLRSQSLQLPLPWVLDWGGLRLIEPEAAMQLSSLFRLWAGQKLEMRWMSGEQLLGVLHESAPTGMRDADPVFWLARLDALRLANRADRFDEAAIDYCVTYEVSPPSWEPARCSVVFIDDNHNSRVPSFLAVSDLSTSFVESNLAEDAAGIEMAQVELAGQLVGDISSTMERLQVDIGTAELIQVNCARLIRVDFIAAGDLLNWVLMRHQEGRQVTLAEAHRLVALFFGAMGINEHAKVQVRRD